ncbi:DUF2690 domain-containing protein [Micromonospora narathiwatensis]|uniref:DUF2690 domain-containing protein n=1 Tax=Micromonospora narathiwatensis TaxID=299146 RepID=A0A1A9AAV0_9ACTN|nr:DUF2690 domain-containing protein [Micromonospora narathiwatensis]SBT53228.1 Protein of unknown function (DUF2690) [Micromonospora narathiwatensis]
MSRLFSLKHVRNILAASVLVAGALVAAPSAAWAGTAADPDVCRNGGGSGYLSCNGKDPNTMGCTAVTVAEGAARNGVYVELRYSSGCQAYWTRYTNKNGASGEARIKGNSVMYKKTLAAYAGETGWTPMAAANQSPHGCLFFYSQDWGQYVEYCVN